MKNKSSNSLCVKGGQATIKMCVEQSDNMQYAFKLYKSDCNKFYLLEKKAFRLIDEKADRELLSMLVMPESFDDSKL